MPGMAESILFIGALNIGGQASAGAMAKNQHLLHFFQGRFEHVQALDVLNLRKRPFLRIKIFFEIIRSKSDRPIILSSSAPSTCFLTKILMALRIQRKVYFWVLGGDLPERVQAGICSPKQLAYFYKVIVEGWSMQSALKESHGLMNTHVVPNFRNIRYFPGPVVGTDTHCRFVFISRINVEKGTGLIIDAVRQLNERLHAENFSVDFFGVIDPEYEDEFLRQVEELDCVSYRGFLDLGNSSNYDVLAGYDVMLFPTFFSGEGFPGILIDAFIAGLPVIASDWNLNRDVIEDGVTGMIIPARDSLALKDAMEQVIQGKLDLKAMSKRCQQQAKQYAIENVLNDDLLVEIGILTGAAS
jgi:glycosyltransferase involved in cell wall biosynthesis